MPADNLDTYTTKKGKTVFFFIDNSISPDGHLFANSVYLHLANSTQIDASNIIITISEERKMNSSMIMVNVNETWSYQLKLPGKNDDFEMACTDAVTFLRTAVAFSNLEKIKTR
jgi:hypothetical protein